MTINSHRPDTATKGHSATVTGPGDAGHLLSPMHATAEESLPGPSPLLDLLAGAASTAEALHSNGSSESVTDTGIASNKVDFVTRMIQKQSHASSSSTMNEHDPNQSSPANTESFSSHASSSPSSDYTEEDDRDDPRMTGAVTACLADKNLDHHVAIQRANGYTASSQANFKHPIDGITLGFRQQQLAQKLQDYKPNDSLSKSVNRKEFDPSLAQPEGQPDPSLARAISNRRRLDYLLGPSPEKERWLAEKKAKDDADLAAWEKEFREKYWDGISEYGVA